MEDEPGRLAVSRKESSFVWLVAVGLGGASGSTFIDVGGLALPAGLFQSKRSCLIDRRSVGSGLD